MSITLLAKAREKGLQESLRLGRDIARARISGFLDPGKPIFVFLSPPMNNSGAPHVLMQIVDDFTRKYGHQAIIRLLSPFLVPDLCERANTSGARVERAAEVMSPTFVRLQLALKQDTFVLMNTVAVPRNYQKFILDSLSIGRLAHAYWYIHEDIDQLPAVAPFLLSSNARSSIGRLVERDRLTLLVPSHKVKTQYDSMFNTTKTRFLPYKIPIGDKYTLQRPASDYTSVSFLLSGRPADGRKGHVVALAAFHEFMKSYYEQCPEQYRQFTLKFVGMTDDYIAEQIRSIGTTILGDRMESISEVSHNKALEITHMCNVVICCSFNEALPVYVLEGMSMGHIVLRNDAGGAEEQLHEGVNGFRVDSRDVKQFASVLEIVLNRKATPDLRLQAMGRASQEMFASLRIASYVEALERVR